MARPKIEKIEKFKDQANHGNCRAPASEVWRAAPDDGIYVPALEVSSEGRIREYGEYLPVTVDDNDGYHFVPAHQWDDAERTRLVCRPTAVHVLVARAFIGKLPKQEYIVHRDGNLANNTAANLKIVPVRSVRGEFRSGADSKNKQRILNEKARRVLLYRSEGKSTETIAAMLDMPTRWTSAIIVGAKREGIATIKPCRDFCKTVQLLILDKGMTDADAADVLGVGPSVIMRTRKALGSKPAPVHADVTNLINAIVDDNVKHMHTFRRVPPEFLQALRDKHNSDSYVNTSGGGVQSKLEHSKTVQAFLDLIK